MKARKITNISETDMGVKLENGNQVYLQPGQSVENIKVKEVSNDERLRVEYDLSEVPVNEGKQQLYG